MAECRKLQNVIKEKDQLMKEKQADIDELRQKAATFESKFLSLSKSEGMSAQISNNYCAFFVLLYIFFSRWLTRTSERR